MKNGEWLEKLKTMKSAQWLLLLLLLGVAGSLLLSGTAGEGGATQEEQRIAAVLSAMAGAGDVRISIFYTEQAAEGAFGTATRKAPSGAVVVAQGAGDLSVRLNLERAVQTLLGLPLAAIDVFAMDGGR